MGRIPSGYFQNADGSLTRDGLELALFVEERIGRLQDYVVRGRSLARVSDGALADGPSVLRGVGHLRGHETDRLAALATEINGLGGSVSETEDGLAIRPGGLHGGVWHAYADHRMATAGAIIGLVVPGVQVDDIATTAKTMPDFPGLWAGMLRT